MMVTVTIEAAVKRGQNHHQFAFHLPWAEKDVARGFVWLCMVVEQLEATVQIVLKGYTKAFLHTVERSASPSNSDFDNVQ